MLWLKNINNNTSVAYNDDIFCSRICQLIAEFRVTPWNFYSRHEAEGAISISILGRGKREIVQPIPGF